MSSKAESEGVLEGSSVARFTDDIETTITHLGLLFRLQTVGYKRSRSSQDYVI